ncbi:MAG: hypothetical protein H6551_01145 [Chitinophagales bacterium]|nr:hypothetical protein [Chitinophagaceae bacterium]MCB9063730.1 hypothetical protein [Chitinophagales bacterium]
MSTKLQRNAELVFTINNQTIEGILNILVIQGMLVLLLDNTLYGESNVLCYSFKGDLIWTISNPVRVHSEYETYFVGTAFQEGKLLVYSKDGVEYDVSLETGTFNKYELVK